jgi:hypothetical protein
MPTGTPCWPKCPKCKRGKWGYPKPEKGVHFTGLVERRLTTSKHQGHGNGGQGFHGHRGLIECHDCGHKWFSTNPRSGRIRSYECTHCEPRAFRFTGEPKTPVFA